MQKLCLSTKLPHLEIRWNNGILRSVNYELGHNASRPTHGKELFSLKMYIRSAKAYDFCMLVCFVFMYALVSCLHTCMVLSDIKRANCQYKNTIPIQTFKKWHNVCYCYVSYVKSETSNIWRARAWFLNPFGERIEGNHTYDLERPNSTVKARTVYRGCHVCYQIQSLFGKWKNWL